MMMVNPEDADRTLTRMVAAQVGVRALTYSQAVAQAKAQLCQLDDFWCSASDAAVAAEVCSNDTLFVGSTDSGRDIRCGLGCPLSNQDCGDGDGNGDGVPPPTGGASTTLLFGALAVVGLTAVVIASRGTKKIVIARVQPRG
jgi:hypothetical protein